MATALYRRYRPEAFSEMIGQAHVTEPLMTALRTGRIGHAYLFSGPRGCGKTTSARILARCLNCAEGPTDTPCGACPSCVELSRDGGGSLDVVEIDAASHGGVDDARELRERAVFAPARDRYKIFIIDEAHMVTSGGFNALLKIVEEPPPHVKFIFATTEPDKVIGTIRSRTHHYPFRLIAPGTLIDYVQQLCDSEGIEVEAGVLPLVVRSGGGSVRDTLSILDQLIAGSEESRVSLERATGLLGFTSTELLDDAITALGAGDSAQAFGATDRVVQTGQDPRRFVEDLLERLRDLIVITATTVQGASAVFRGVPDDQLQRMFEQAQAFAPGQLSRIADTVSEALDHMTGATAPRLHLELMVARALVEQARSGSVQGQSGALGHGGAQGHSGAQGHGAAPAPARPAPASAPVAPAPAQVPPSTSSAAAPAAASAPANPSNGPTPAAPAVTPTADAGVDVIATLKSAREFLNGGGAPKAPMVPLGGHAPAEEKSNPGAAAPSTSSGSGAEDRSADATPPAPGSVDSPGTAAQIPEPVEGPGATGSSTPPVGIDELRELWPELLEELLESDREAWNAVKNVQPLALEGDALTVGLTSRSDLEVFKTSGAAPLREVIGAAVGISVKYVPRQLPPGSAPAASETTASEPHDAEPSPTAEPSQTPESAAAGAPEAKTDPAASTEDSSDSPPPVSEPAPGAEPVTRAEPDADPAPAAQSAVQPDPSLPPDEPSDLDEQDDPYGDPGFDAAPEPRQGQAPDPQPIPKPVEAQAPPTPSDQPKKPSTVGFAAALAAQAEQVAATPQLESTRYGESVVRELLGARFIEERPLPQNEE